MPMGLEVEEVSISSGSMSHTFDPLTGTRFSSSLSRRSVPHGSARASSRRKTFSAAMEHSAVTNISGEDDDRSTPRTLLAARLSALFVSHQLASRVLDFAGF